MRISVIGTNYLGAAHAAGMAELGHEVRGVDIDQSRVDTLNSGLATFFEPDLEPMLARHTASGRLTFTTDYANIADWADVHFLCVGTPQAPDGSADLSQVYQALDSLGSVLTKPCIIAGKSTVPVGTAPLLQARIDAIAPDAHAEVVWNPEFLREGHAVHDTLHPSRIVVGTRTPQCIETMKAVYALPISDGAPFLTTDVATAELIKTAANTFLAMKISFINALSEMCQASGGDIAVLADALGMDSRIGREFLNAGLGFGGGCLPKDVSALAHRATELGVDDLSHLIGAITEINDAQRNRIVDMTIAQLGGTQGRTVAILGAAFKPNTDDTRNSPALDVAKSLAAAGAHVRVYDPQAHVQLPGIEQAATIDACLDKADITLHLTEWPQFRQLDPRSLTMVTTKTLIDARLKLDPKQWEAAGWLLIQPGRTHL